MTFDLPIPHNVLWAMFALVALVVIGGTLFLLIRGERVGTLRLLGRIELDLVFARTAGSALRIGLTVAREGGPSPKVQMRTTMPMSMSMERLDPAEALTLAQFLDEASSRLRAP